MEKNNILNLVVPALVSLAFLMLVFIPLEKVFPAKKGQKIVRYQWLLDFCFFMGQYILWSGAVLWTLNYFSEFLTGIIPINFQNSINKQPFLLITIEVLLLSDFLIYWGHRLQHRVNFLWRFHKVHHSVTHLDWLAAHREHPLDSIYTIGIINLPAFIIGFPLESIAGIIAFRGIWAIFIHANVKINIGWLKMFIGAPELHHWHHAKDRKAGNYANISPLMDIIFGTYYCPDKEPEALGIQEATPKTYLGQLIEPLLPQKIWNRIKRQIKLL